MNQTNKYLIALKVDLQTQWCVLLILINVCCLFIIPGLHNFIALLLLAFLTEECVNDFFRDY